MNSKRRKDAKGIVIILAFLIMSPGIVLCSGTLQRAAIHPWTLRDFQDVVKRMKARNRSDETANGSAQSALDLMTIGRCGS